jgi:methylmalonyl-CoA/ethylmalonyl-CoA epimerase
MERSAEAETKSWKIMQVGVVVRDVKKAIEQLSSLGIGPFEPKTLPPDRKEWFRGEPMDAEFNIHAARVGDVELELIQPISGESPHKEFLETKGEGIQHVMFAVDDFDKELDRLTKNGASVLLKAEMPGGRGLAYVDLNAANFVVELIQKR